MLDSLKNNFRRFGIYQPNINYTYNYDQTNLFGLNQQEEWYGKDILTIALSF